MDENLPPVEKNLTSEKQPNAWQWLSVILAVALVAVSVFAFKGGGDKPSTANERQAAAQDLVDFINLAYGSQVGNSSLQSVEEESGNYRVTLSILDNGAPSEFVVFVSKDGRYFFPQVVDVNDIMTQIETFEATQGAEGELGDPAMAVPDADAEAEL